MTPYVSDIMNFITLTALNKSIEHWTRHATRSAANGEGVRSEDCSLCEHFYSYKSLKCYGCPVMERTGMHCCVCSPWQNAIMRFRRDIQWMSPRLQSGEFVESANAELAFLKSLLPERYQPVQPITTMLPLI